MDFYPEKRLGRKRKTVEITQKPTPTHMPFLYAVGPCSVLHAVTFAMGKLVHFIKLKFEGQMTSVLNHPATFMTGRSLPTLLCMRRFALNVLQEKMES